METVAIGQSSLRTSRLAYGCWRIAGASRRSEAQQDAYRIGRHAILAAYDAGYTLFDHADIYCEGLPEEIFGRVLREVSGMRESVVIASKCGIRLQDDPPGTPYRYDLSADYIVRSCEASLQRLGVETIDLYQLHRADWLADWSEVAEAFSRLRAAGKVREFGASNFRPAQVAGLQRALSQKLVGHQVEISLLRLEPFEDGTLDQTGTEALTPLAWSPLAGGRLVDGTGAMQTALDRAAKAHAVSRSAIAIAWLLRHPARIVPIIGSSDPQRIRDAAHAESVELTREAWYTLLEAARGSRLA